MLAAHCKPQICIYEKTTQVPVLGEPGHRKRSMRFTVALCGDMDPTSDTMEEILQKAERYELTADIMRDDGIVERFYFHDISLVEIDPAGGWEFELRVTKEQKKKLSAMAGI